LQPFTTYAREYVGRAPRGPAHEVNALRSIIARPGRTQHALGPIVYRVSPLRPLRARLIAGAILCGCAAILVTAARLAPDPAGMGTHRQLGMAPCSLVVFTGYPCPTCGMTTAFAHTVRGELLSAFNAHPAGLVFALAVIATMSVSLSVLLTGRVWAVNWYRVAPTRVALAVVLVLLGGWGYKLAVGVLSGALPIHR